MRVSTNAIKSVDHRGGLDAFLIKAKATELSPRALELKRQIEKKTAAAAPVARLDTPRKPKAPGSNSQNAGSRMTAAGGLFRKRASQ